MKPLLQFYRKMSLREKVLATAFIWVLLFIGSIFVIDRLSVTWREWSATTKHLRVQGEFLAMAPLVERQLAERLQAFNPERTFDSASLIGRVDAIARQVGIQADFSTPRTQQGEKFEFHTMRVSVRRTPIDRWLLFADRIRAESPYMNLESVRLSADQRNRELLDGQFVLNSFELKATFE